MLLDENFEPYVFARFAFGPLIRAGKKKLGPSIPVRTSNSILRSIYAFQDQTGDGEIRTVERVRLVAYSWLKVDL